jgi:elongation factor Ts
MPDITPEVVAKLREMTNAGFLQCKTALIEAGGDLQKAVDVLRKKGQATAAKAAAKEAKDGLIVQTILPGARAGILVEVNCNTDFVARNDDFKAFCDEVARALLANPQADLEAARTAMVAKLGENIQIRRHQKFEIAPGAHGLIAAYIHTGGKVGVLVEVGAGKESTVANDDFKQLVKDITLQIAAGSPGVVRREEVPAAVLEKEKEIAAEQFKNKPPQAIAKIVEGKLDKFYQTYCLVDQGFVKKNSEISVKDHVASVAKALGDDLTIRRFVRFQVGEVTT